MQQHYLNEKKHTRITCNVKDLKQKVIPSFQKEKKRNFM